MSVYSRYSAYKSSNDESIKEIPTHWKMWKVGHAFKTVGSGTTPSTDNIDYYDGDIPWVTTSELREKVIFNTTKKLTELALQNHSALTIYPPNTLLIAMYGATVGRLGILGIQACTNQACCALADSEILQTKFMYYWLWAQRNEIISLSSGGGQPNINQEKVRSLKVSTPPLEEQQAIVAFLDEKTKVIDQLISEKQALIQLLHEKRNALISHAVTKGLDPHAPLKDSGTIWFGEIPRDWQIMPLKFLTTKIIDGTHHTPTYVDEGVPFLRVTDIHGTEIDFDKVRRIPEEEHIDLIRRCNPQKGDLLLSKNGTIGIPRVIDWDDEFSIFVSLCLIKVRSELNVHFAKYFFLSQQIDAQINYGGKTNTITNLHLDKIQNFIFPLPPYSEQVEIVANLDEQTNKYNELIAEVEAGIATLQEYRTALISAAVTGKIDVRNL